MDTIAKITVRCFFLAMGLLLLWFLMYVEADDAMYDFHSQWFDITKQEFAVMHYSGMMYSQLLLYI